jgi:hypothetical protein
MMSMSSQESHLERGDGLLLDQMLLEDESIPLCAERGFEDSSASGSSFPSSYGKASYQASSSSSLEDRSFDFSGSLYQSGSPGSWCLQEPNYLTSTAAGFYTPESIPPSPYTIHRLDYTQINFLL